VSRSKTHGEDLCALVNKNISRKSGRKSGVREREPWIFHCNEFL